MNHEYVYSKLDEIVHVCARFDLSVHIFKLGASRAGTISSCRLRGDRTRQNQIHAQAYFSEILILLRFAANSIPALGPCRASLTPFSFPRLTPPAPPTKAPPPPTEL